MSNMDIKILDYVSEDDIKDAILSGIKDYSREEAERIITNAGYRLATDIANAQLDDEAGAKIYAKAVALLDELSTFTLFDLGGYGRPPSDARRILNDAVRQEKDALSYAIRSAIHNLSKREIVDIVKSGAVKIVIE